MDKNGDNSLWFEKDDHNFQKKWLVVKKPRHKRCKTYHQR